MSYLSVLAVAPDRRPAHLAEFRNSHGWHPSIWDRLLRHHRLGSWPTFNDRPLERLWGMIDTLPEWQQVPLVLTFDTGVIPHTAFAEAADLFDEFDRRLPSEPRYVNHVPAMAELLRTSPETPLLGTAPSFGNPFDPWDQENDRSGSGIPLSAMHVLPQHRDVVLRMFDWESAP